ncbi:hypothetical protein [Orientia tsutsugamushi]|uniref:Uncharacterized protein n=2 Tax=Orientia tsutsugamushi TaxID=784 RepID=A0A2U3QPD0_ORITS|nr:hypothetical protein [Orientia tsutsugamushi]KJV51438.1 putative ompA-like autotransporter domain protein [Orientia tsutsugamushi str. Kato PP]SPR02798.1 Uncharacterised protein [Orientia tsutsugamushi]
MYRDRIRLHHSAPHRMELMLGLLRDYVAWANSIQGHYYYNILDGKHRFLLLEV